MLLSHTIEKKKNNNIIFIPIEKISKWSRVLVDVSCDYCGIILNIPYYRYIEYTKVCDKYSCSKKDCSNKKIKEVNLIKYGVDSPMKLQSTKDKLKKSTLDKYGVENVFQSEIIKEKSKKTVLDKYGVDNIMKLEENIKKVKKTNLEKYGNEHPSKLDFFKEKSKETKLEKYGNKNYNNREKNKKTVLDKYGVENIMYHEKFRKENFKISENKYYLNYLNKNISLFKCDLNEKHNFEITSDLYLSRSKYNIPLCTICYPIGFNKSIKEKKLLEFIQSNYDDKIISSYRDGLEIDIYIPELNLGIEFNGLYWHSEVNKSKNYHLEKTNYFKERGIKIIHIWEDDWDYKRNIVESQIKNILRRTENKIYARKCYTKEIKDTKIIKDFLNNNHIQGWVNNKLSIGLYYKDELVSLMSFDHFEGRKKMENDEWNLNRFCTILNTNVIGSASKLLKYFIDNYQPTRIISYADKDWSSGNLYNTLGFIKLSESKPDYKYIVDKKRNNKSRFRKSNTGISESKLNFLKVFDCGKIKYELKFNI